MWWRCSNIINDSDELDVDDDIDNNNDDDDIKGLEENDCRWYIIITIVIMFASYTIHADKHVGKTIDRLLLQMILFEFI